MSNKFRNIRRLGEDAYQVMLHKTDYKCDTCLQEAFFTLDNAKYWYLVFVYEFMHKCLDMDRVHFISGDTDSMYFAIAGDPNKDYKQGFEAIVKDREFYDDNVFKFLPYDFHCFDESKRPICTTPTEKIASEKKLLGLAVEKQGTYMISLCPKVYVNDYALKCKGVNLKQNKETITKDSFFGVLILDTKYDGNNINLQLKDGKMSRITISKTALTGKMTKAYVYENGCCAPLIKGYSYV